MISPISYQNLDFRAYFDCDRLAEISGFSKYNFYRILRDIVKRFRSCMFSENVNYEDKTL